jgi:hypothetical protein
MKINTDWLPVLREGGSFYGIVERTKLISSLVLDVTDQLSGDAAANK